MNMRISSYSTEGSAVHVCEIIAVDIVIQHEAKPSAVWPIETAPRVPLLLVKHVYAPSVL